MLKLKKNCLRSLTNKFIKTKRYVVLLGTLPKAEWWKKMKLTKRLQRIFIEFTFKSFTF